MIRYWNLPTIKWIPNEDGYDYIPLIGESKSIESTNAKYVTGYMLENGLLQVCNLSNKKATYWI